MRPLVLLPVLLGAAGAAPASDAPYFPPPDARGGWRTRAPARRAALDDAFAAAQAGSKHGGLLVAQHGWLIYERYFGRGHRDAAPNTASCGKSFTSIACGILMAERSDLFPDGLDQKIYSPRYLPAEAFPPREPRMLEIRLGQLLAMTAGIRGNNPGRVRGRPVTLDPPGPDGWPAMLDSAPFALPLWCVPGEGYSYATASIHLASMIVREVSGMELEQFVRMRLAEPLGWGRWGWGYRRPEIKHTPGGGGIVLRATDMLRFAYLLLREGRWGGRQLVPAAYVRQCGRLSPYNPHAPVSLAFDVNGDGHVAGVPRDAFWKQGSGGHCLYVVPSLDLVVWKLGGRDEQYSAANTGLEPAAPPYDGSRDGWKPEIDAGGAAIRTLQLVVAAVR